MHVRITAIHDTDRWSTVPGVVGSTGHFRSECLSYDLCPSGYKQGVLYPDLAFISLYKAETPFAPFFLAVQYEVLDD